MNIGTPDSPRPVTSAHRGRRYFTRTAGLALLTPAVLAFGFGLAGAASATDAPANNSQEVECPWDNGADITNVQYIVDGTTYSTLEGHTHAGATVKVTFTIAEGCEDDTFSLATYKAPSATYVAGEAPQQVLFDSKTGSFDAGAHSLTLTLPSCYYQVDFVRGAVIEHLTADAYANAGHLIDHDNGGTTSCVTTTTTPTPSSTPPTPTETATVLGTTLTQDPTPSVAPAVATLPFTGSTTPILLALGAALVGAGIAFRVAATRRVARRH